MFFRKNPPGSVGVDLHIGTHKTGTTSIQAFLFENRARLKLCGRALYAGRPVRRNHVDLYLASLRPERDSFLKLRQDIATGDAYSAAVARHVQTQIRRTSCSRVIMTTEGLSLLRHDDELARLKTILGASAANTRVILFLRDREDFKRSWRAQVTKWPGRSVSTDETSVLYAEDDSWVFDFGRLVEAYTRAFGAENVVVRSYDAAMRENGNVLPEFLAAIDLDPTGFGDLSRYMLNRRSPEV